MAINEGFDFGTDEEIKDPGEDFKQPEEGDHSARLRSIVHVGMFRETFNGEKKKPFPTVIAVFELKEDTDFEDDGVTPLTMSKVFPLKKGDRAFMTKFLAALDPKGAAKGFDDVIGAACTITCKGGKEKKDDGTQKYINFGGIAGLPAKFASMLEPLAVKGVGHCRFPDITKEAILELSPVREVNMILMQGENYAGSKAETIINEIRKDNPDFAVRKKKDEGSDTEKKGKKEDKPVEKPVEKESNLSDEEEF